METTLPDAVLIEPEEFSKPLKLHRRPCDYGLEAAVSALETQLGTTEAYNRIVVAAHRLRLRIKAGDTHEPVPGAAVPGTE